MPAKRSRSAKSKGRRRARGTGSIFFHEGRQRWVARKVVNGTPVERWGETQREAIDKLAEALPPDPNSCTVTAWANRWRNSLAVRKSTKTDYASSLDLHILPAIGSTRLAAVTTVDIERLIAKLSADLEAGTVRKIVAHCRSLFAAAVRSELIQRNPATYARKPRATAGEIETYTAGQLARIITTATRFASGGVIACLAATGMRVGEVLALDVADWDATAGTISIDKTYSLRFGTGGPKSRHSRRTITVPDVLRAVLVEAAGGRKAGPLFTTTTGNRRPAQTVIEPWRATLKLLKLPYLKLHCLRHSVATALIAESEPIPDVARFLGDSVTTIVKFYVHATGRNPVGTLNRLYGGRTVGAIPPAPPNA
jgi:integrase